MIEFLSSWAKGLGLAIVIVSILEMLLPNNRTKKYIRMVMGIYVLFTVISPFIKNKEIFNFNEVDLDKYMTTQTSTSSVIDQSSMDERIQNLYIQELEKDITKKIEEKGFDVTKCRVETKISDNEKESKITKIKLNVQKSEKQNVSIPQEDTDKIENKVVTEIQKIKPIDTNVKIKNTTDNNINNSRETNKEKKLTRSDIQNIKKFLIEEYEVNEKCLEIN
ncbi:MAG: stage III sporulation protein AF [Clostridia bacterium]|nr:stage III sporulation protein AF [Clostridia bacterium]